MVAAGAGEAHDVTIHPGVEPTEILIDGQPATKEELPAVEAVLNHTAEQIAEKPQEDAPETDEAKRTPMQRKSNLLLKRMNRKSAQ